MKGAAAFFLLFLPLAMAKPKTKNCSSFISQAKPILKKRKQIKTYFFSKFFEQGDKVCEDKLSYSPQIPVLTNAILTQYKSEAIAQRKFKEFSALLITPFGPKKDLRTNTNRELIAAFELGGTCHTRFVFRHKNKIFNYSFINYARPCLVKRTPGYSKAIWQAGKAAAKN